MSDEKVDILTGEYVPLSFGKADLTQRIGAVAIDWIIVGLISYFVITGVEGLLRNFVVGDQLFLLLIIYFFAISFLNLFIEYFSKGYTIGKLATGIRIISDECVPPTFLQCFMRWVLFPIDIWVVGMIFIAQKGQRLGDMASGCQCISKYGENQEKVDLNTEFEYLRKNYKVRYPEAQRLNTNEINIITKVLYYKQFKERKADTARKLEQRLKIKSRGNDTDFLKQVLNDYKYLNM